MLPVKDLVYPGATEKERTFHQEVKGRTVDGRPVDQRAYLYRRFEPLQQIVFADVRTWYGEQLVADGWESLTEDPGNPKRAAWGVTRNGWKHAISVEDPNRDAQSFTVYYFIEAAG